MASNWLCTNCSSLAVKHQMIKSDGLLWLSWIEIVTASTILLMMESLTGNKAADIICW